MLNNIEDALTDFKNGKMLIVIDNEDRENEGDIIFNAKFADNEKINFCIKECGGLICLALSQKIADKVDLKPMQQINRDIFGTAFYESIDANEKYGVTTGVSAKDRAITAELLSRDNISKNDFRKPGHLFPLVSRPYGVLERMGHTESAVDLSKFCNLPEAAIICEIIKKDGAMMRKKDLEIFAKHHNIKMISVEQIKNYSLLNISILEKSEIANLPTEFGNFNIKVYKNPINKIEHAVIYKIQNKNKPIVRIHSECLTGDIFCSLKCDCKQQLHFSLQEIEKNGHGFLLYNKGHEGRGIGLFNKINAYKLQESNVDTYQANKILGFDADLRNYHDAVMILKDLALDNFILLTGNSSKSIFLKNLGFSFINQPLPAKKNFYNSKYLADKINIMNHNIIIE